MIDTQLGEPCVMPDSPKAEQYYSETRLEWEERLGDSSRTVNVEAYMTADVLLRLVRELMGGSHG